MISDATGAAPVAGTGDPAADAAAAAKFEEVAGDMLALVIFPDMIMDDLAENDE